MSLAIVHDQSIVYAAGFGYSDLDRQVKAWLKQAYEEAG